MKDLETKNLIIRKFKLEDAEDVHKNLATITKLTDCSGYHVHKDIVETKIMISSFINEYEMNELVWALEEKKSGEVIGYINALEFSIQNKLCEIKFGIKIGLENAGIMEEALEKVLDYLFKEKGFNTVAAKFYDSNSEVTKIKCRTLENVGMTKEAVLRNRRINEITKKPENKIIYSILKEEFCKE